MFTPEFVCLWRILDYSHQILLGICVYIFGLVGISLNSWLIYAFFKSRSLTFKSHLFLLSLCLASLTKSILTGFIFAGTSALAGRWVFGVSTCHLFAFLRQILGVFQIIIFTIISVERYLLFRPQRKGNDLPLWFYVTSICLSWIFSALFSLPPLLGYGSYNCDVTGTICELDWRNLTPRQVGFNVLYLIFVGCTPILTIFTCLWTVNCSDKITHQITYFDHHSFTKTVTIMIAIIFTFWIPQTILSMWIFIQNSHPPKGISVALSVIAPISNEASEIIPVLCYLSYDVRLRSGLLEVIEQIRNRRSVKRNIKMFSKK